MRNLSFALTTAQFRARTKTVTRRVGRFWTRLKIGELVCGVEKAQGIPKGGLVRLGVIRIVDVGVEHLDVLVNFPSYGAQEVVKEGFPDMTPAEFVAMFRKHMPRVLREPQVTRIEFEHVTDGGLAAIEDRVEAPRGAAKEA